MVGFFVPTGFEPVTLTTRSGLTTHSVTDYPTPRGRLFKGKMITLCGRFTNIPMISHETLTEEEFEFIRLVENNAPFALLLGKT
jgi:hypothetical protein